MAQPAPTFATTFGDEHWQFLEANYPLVILHWPRLPHLLFLASVLLGFLAAVELGDSKGFRRALLDTLGLSGLALAVYALGIRWLGWTSPPWIKLAGDTEQFNVWFFHHNGPGACFLLAWPLLLFRENSLPRRAAGVALAVVAIAALPLWHSSSPAVIAGGIFVLGMIWRILAAKITAWPQLVRGTIVTLFLGIFAWQISSTLAMRRDFPDGWVSAAETLQNAPARDAAFKMAADRRGDRLVASPAPPRPAAWLTAARMAADYPLVGLGPGAWVTHAVLYSNDSLVNTFHQHRQFAHHDLLQTAAEWGGLAALAWLVIWIGAFWLATSRDASGRFTEMDLVLSLLGIAVHSMVHFPLQNPALLLWTVLLLGLAWSRRPGSEVGSAPIKLPA
jgi:O-Antigen ligase